MEKLCFSIAKDHLPYGCIIDEERKIESIESYGHYYRLRKGFKKPQPITVLDMDGNKVIFAWGHLSAEELKENRFRNEMDKGNVIVDIPDFYK